MKKLLSIALAMLTAASLLACADLGEPAGPGDAPTGKEQTYTVTANYDYGMHRPNRATMLYNSSTLFFPLPEGYDPPVAGDEFAITYTGELLIQESYPSTVVITDGKITGVTAEPALIRQVRYNAANKSLTLLDENGEDRVIEGGISFPEYYIIDVEGHYAELSSLTEDTILYGSISYTDRMEDGGITFSALYAENPRPFEMEKMIKIRKVTDEYLRKSCGITDLSAYNVRMDYVQSSDQYSVKYELWIGEYHTNESVRIRLSSDLTVVDCNYPNSGQYSRYLKNATDEAVRTAEERLRAKTEGMSGGSGFYLQVDQEGYLCLAVEYIVDIDPPKLDEDGNEIGGCGYDHDHVFYTERICNAD